MLRSHWLVIVILGSRSIQHLCLPHLNEETLSLQFVEYVLSAPLAFLIWKTTLLVLFQLFIRAASSAVQGVSTKPVSTCCKQVYLTCYLKHVNSGANYFPFHTQVSLKRKPKSSVHIRAKYAVWVICGDKVLEQKRKEPV